MRRDSGFTLIELVVVIVVLGILAAFAVPRFVGMQSEARNATLQGIEGSIHGVASMTHAKCLAQGNKACNDTIDVEGASINMTHGYPAESDIQDAMKTGSNNNLDFSSGKFSYDQTTNCYVNYNNTGNETTPDYNVSLNASGC